MTKTVTGEYRLYGRDGTGSAASEAALAEVGAAHVIIDVPKDRDEARAQGFHDINPRGQVPALVHPGGTVITEGTAILLHLADAFPDRRLAPPPGSPERARHDRWLLFLHANVYEGELRRYYPERYVDAPDCAPSVERAALTYVGDHYRMAEQALSDGPFSLGQELSMLDIYLWMLVQWFDGDWIAAHCPKISRLAKTVAERPLIAPIHARHFGSW